MERLPKIAVVGSGPVGSVIAIKLLNSLDEKAEVTLIDVARDKVNLEFSSYWQNRLVKGRTIPNGFFQKIKEGRGDHFHLNLIGGYSNVWGATWQSPSKYGSSLIDAYSELKLLLEKVEGQIENFHFSTNIKEGNSICDCMAPFLLKDSGESPTFLNKSSLLLNKLRIASDALEEASVSFTPWNSKTAIHYLHSFSSFSLKYNTWVEKFTEKVNCVVLHTSQGQLEFDFAIFACGPIETSKLLMRSLPNLSQVQLLDTQMTYSMLIRRPSKNSQRNFGLSHIASELKIEGESTVELHTQYYAHLYNNKDLVLQRLPRFLWKPTTLFLRIFDPFLVVAINYLSSSASGTILVNRDKNQQDKLKISLNQAENHRQEFAGIYKVFSRKIKKIGLLTTRWLVFHQAPGKSFHYGASPSKISNKAGKVIGCSRSYISGAICLPEIHPGPITTPAMSHGIMVANQIIKEIER